MHEPRHMRILAMTESAMAVALSVLLGNLRLLELPNGGSIAFATLPLLALAAHRGLRAGLTTGLCAGAAHAMIGGTIIHPAQLGLDYLLAYAALALIAVPGASTPARRVCGTLLAMATHLAFMVLSGVVFFAPVAGGAALSYSLAYNATTVVPETLIALWLLPVLVRALARANPAHGWRSGVLPLPPTVHQLPRSIIRQVQQPPPGRVICPPMSMTRTPAPIARPAPGFTSWRAAPRAHPAQRLEAPASS